MLPTSDMKIFEEQLKNPNIDFTNQNVEVKNKPSKVMKVNKNIVITYPCDKGGCSFYRANQPFNYLNYIFKENFEIIQSNHQAFIYQEDILARTRMIFFQRVFSPSALPGMKLYKELQKKYGFKIIFELDDFIWKNLDNPLEGIPPYNPGYEGITDDIRKATNEIMSMCDLITVSSEFMGNYIRDVVGIKVPIVFIKNSVAQYMWGTKRRPQITEKITKPKVIYTGSPLHYSNGVVQKNGKLYFDKSKQLLGDFEISWAEWILKAVKDDKIEMCFMGGLPFFLEEVKDKIKVIKWINPWVYHIPIQSYQPDFFIGPLCKNHFNASKSDIKMIEAFASGGAFVGTVFSGDSNYTSPYDTAFLKLPDTATVQDIERCIEDACEPNIYNAITEKQYNFMLSEGRYLESAAAIKMWSSIL